MLTGLSVCSVMMTEPVTKVVGSEVGCWLTCNREGQGRSGKLSGSRWSRKGKASQEKKLLREQRAERREQRSESREQRAESMEQRAENREQRTGSRKQGAENREQIAVIGELRADIK